MTDTDPKPPPSLAALAYDRRRIECRRIATALMQHGSLGQNADPIAAAVEARDNLNRMLEDASAGR